ncbi:lipoyl(octanoyl) transferase LipB [Flavobacteriales bacterium]|nr:lipoyl(octanoyl) transferase LipB [Flavobacteriales bacterium]MDC1063212.1 lipoyl(octanoyl) transferase LipB [Flavobacteriales bacterium]
MQIAYFKDIGLIEYKEAWLFQEKFFNKILEIKSKNRNEGTEITTKNHLIFCEHPHVYTLGNSGNKENLLVNEDYLKSRGASFYKTNRGGDITYHGPGQIVGYPIFDLDNFFNDIGKYLRFLEEVIILTLKEYGLNGERSKGETGVWLDVGKPTARKICAMGVKTSRWVSMHGFAFNINTDLSYFENIIPCGINDKKVTSLEKEIGHKIDICYTKTLLKSNIERVFDLELK